MRMAFTIDDLPVYPHLALREGHSPQSVAKKISESLARHGLTGVFAMANSWPLDVDPAYSQILDNWVAAGHHIGNHTHSHPMLNDTDPDDFTNDISVADELLAPWIAKAPLRAFRHPLDYWGNTENKRVRVNEHLALLGYRSADVTSWFYEWEWDRAWQFLLQSDRIDEAETLKAEFIDYAAAQVVHDAENCRDFFERDVVAIGLAHNVAFFAEVADAFFARLLAEGVKFVPLVEALDDPAYSRSGSIVTDAFQVYQVKIAAADGLTLIAVPRSHQSLMDKVIELATPLRPARRGMLVQNSRQRIT